MTCQYCTAKNGPEDERCQRCGRRIHTAHQRPSASRTPVSNSSLAHALSLEPEARYQAPAKSSLGPQIVPPAASARAAAQPAYQGSLFGPQLFSAQESAKHPGEVARRGVKPKPEKSVQQSLDFLGALPLGNHALKTSVEARIFCGTPIAQAPLRIMAAAADLSVGLVGVGVYAATFRLMGQELVWTPSMLFSYLAAAIVISLFYRVLFCLANGDTPGSRWVGLRVLDFDGRVPSRKQRFQRLAGGCLGALAVGLGLLWALFDEERLTWHDHMSQTFPAFRG